MKTKRIIGWLLVALVTVFVLHQGFGVKAAGPEVERGARVTIIEVDGLVTANGLGVFDPGVEIQVVRLEKPNQFIGLWYDPQKDKKIDGAVPLAWINETIHDGSKAVERAQQFSIAAVPTWGPSCGCDWTPWETILIYQWGPKVLEAVMRIPEVQQRELVRTGFIPVRRAPPWFGWEEDGTIAAVVIDDPAGNPDGVYFTYPLHQYGKIDYRDWRRVLGDELLHWVSGIRDDEEEMRRGGLYLSNWFQPSSQTTHILRR